MWVNNPSCVCLRPLASWQWCGLPTVGCNAVRPVAKVTVQVDCREESECMHAGITECHQDLLNEWFLDVCYSLLRVRLKATSVFGSFTTGSVMCEFLLDCFNSVWGIQLASGFLENVNNRPVNSTFPGGLAPDLGRCPVGFFVCFFCLPNVPKWSFTILAIPNKSKINHKSVSLDWQRRASCLFLASHQMVLNRVDARDLRKERKWSEETVKCNMVVSSIELYW